ncbi:unnamed protein product [Soboliphyme baturini]|uniref:Uncharacterized protein n=1 Tax=Soboliphyme baturini TaxID=241478 RepID=A0A183IIV4_9BILA|nr:unnamed protein product [Soboliphyme baturini]
MPRPSAAQLCITRERPAYYADGRRTKKCTFYVHDVLRDILGCGARRSSVSPVTNLYPGPIMAVRKFTRADLYRRSRILSSAPTSSQLTCLLAATAIVVADSRLRPGLSLTRR